MELRPSLYQSVQSSRRVKRKVFGVPSDSENIYAQDYVELNLPGSPTYQPGQPWVSKHTHEGTIAPDLYDYVDDLRNMASTQEEAWEGSAQVAKVLSYHRNQVAAQKKRQVTQQMGAWAGTIGGTSPERVYVPVTQE